MEEGLEALSYQFTDNKRTFSSNVPHLPPWGLGILIPLGIEVFPMDSSIFFESQEARKAK